MNLYDRKKGLQASINRWLEDGPTCGCLFRYKDLLGAVHNDKAALHHWLDEWQQVGLLRILKNPVLCAPDDYCVEMRSFIGRNSPIKGWLNWEENAEPKAAPPQSNDQHRNVI